MYNIVKNKGKEQKAKALSSWNIPVPKILGINISHLSFLIYKICVGDELKQEDIKAKYQDGILKLSVPKEEPKKVETTKHIAIEG